MTFLARPLIGHFANCAFIISPFSREAADGKEASIRDHGAASTRPLSYLACLATATMPRPMHPGLTLPEPA